MLEKVYNMKVKFSDPESNIKQMNISEGMDVADFGCGVGFYSLALAKRVGPYGHIYAIDIQPEHLSKLKKEAVHRGYDNVEIIRGNLEAPGGSGLLAHSVDRVVISNVLFQVDDMFLVAEEARRIIKPSGLVGVIDWTESFKQVGPHPDHVVDADRIKKVFELTGFQLVSRLDAGSHHYGFLFKIARDTI